MCATSIDKFTFLRIRITVSYYQNETRMQKFIHIPVVLNPAMPVHHILPVVLKNPGVALNKQLRV